MFLLTEGFAPLEPQQDQVIYRLIKKSDFDPRQRKLPVGMIKKAARASVMEWLRLAEWLVDVLRRGRQRCI